MYSGVMMTLGRHYRHMAGFRRSAKIPEERAIGIPGLIARDKVVVTLTTV